MKEKDNRNSTRQKKRIAKKPAGATSNNNSTNGKLSIPEPPPAKQMVKKERTNDVICIIGMHRSGTSLVARLLNLCGLDLGPPENLMESNESNPLGFFENKDFTYKINDALLTHLGGSWDNPPRLKEGWEYDASLEQFVQPARELIQSFSKSPWWGWKDPRTTILLPFWKSLIPNLRFVICVRSPLEVAKSLSLRDRIPLEKGVNMWNQYMQASILHTQDSPRSFIFYEDLFDKAASEITRIVEFCGLKKPQNLSSLCDVIYNELRHHTSETLDLLEQDKLLTEHKLFYLGLRALTTRGFVPSTSDGNQEALVSTNISKFFKLLEQFHDEQLMAQLQSALVDKEEKLTRLHDTLHRQQQSQHHKEEQLAKLRAQQQTLKHDLGNLHTVLNEKEKLVVNLTAEQERAAKEADTLQSTLQIEQQRHHKKEEQVTHLTAEQRRLMQEIETLQSTLQTEQQRHYKKEEQVTHLTAEQRRLTQEADNLESKVQTQDQLLKENEQRLAELAEREAEQTSETQGLQRSLQQKDKKVKFGLTELKNLSQKRKELELVLEQKERQLDQLQTASRGQRQELDEKELLTIRLTSRQGHLTKEVQGLNTSLQRRSERVKFVLEELKSLNQKLKDVRLALQPKQEQIEQLENSAETQQKALKERTYKVAKLEAGIEARDQSLKRRNDNLRDIVVEKEQLREILRVISGSFGWRLTTRLHLLENKILPEGSFIRRTYDLFWTAMKTLVFRGWTVFVYESKNKLKEFRENKKQPHLKKPSAFQPLTFKEVEDPKVSIIIPVFNQSHYTYQCLKSILENTPQDLYEVIVVDDRSTDNTQKILKKIRNIKVINNAENLGFLINCNNGSKDAKGEYILYLNNDTEVTQGWLTSMLSIFERFEKVGAVGAKLVYPNGKLQEAGGIIWQDGSGWNYGKMDDAEKPEYNYVREVDYCSAACLIVREDLLREIDYFDERYIPGYFEDTDLAFSIREQGCRVIYQPEAVVIHHEGISAGTDLTKGFKKSQAVNQAKFVEKWQSVLEKHFSPPDQLTDPIAFIAREKCKQKQILVVDHYVPEFDKDSGSLRMSEYIRILVQLGHKVVFLPDNRFRSMPYTQSLQRIGVEVLYGHFDFEDYLKKFGKFFDVGILSRPHIAIKYLEMLKRHANIFLIYDTVDLGYVREKRKAELSGNTEGLEKAEALKRTELFLAAQSDMTIVVSDVEKDILLKEDPTLNVEMIPHVHRLASTIPGYAERENLIFIGGFQHAPNVDGIQWFVEQIFPKIQEICSEIKLYIIGSNPPEEITRLNNEHIIVTGYLPNVDTHFNSSRVFVAPLRYGAGINGKILHSMSYGVPVVTTSVGAEGLNLKDCETAMVASDETEFSEKVLRLYKDEKLWTKVSSQSIDQLRHTHTSDTCMKKFKQIFSN